MEPKKKIIIIGGGVAGMATGSYAQMSGFDTQIFEMHVLPGGCCTSWSRRGFVFDYCIEWLIGSGGGNDANQVWRELGALDGKSIKNFESFNRVVDEHGQSVVFYTDPDRLARHLAEVSPADAAVTRVFCEDLRRFTRTNLYPFLKPKSLMTWREKLAMLGQILPHFRLFWRTGAMSTDAFCAKLQSPLLKRAIPNIFSQDFEGAPILLYLFNLAAAHNGNAGFPEGGSLGLSRSIEERYRSLGGKITYRARVAKILVENDRAVGIELEDGTQHRADIVVSACDGYTTIYKMLGGRYLSDTVETLYKKILPLPKRTYPGVMSVFLGVNGEFPADAPHSTTYLLSDKDAAALPWSLQRTLAVQHRTHYSPGFAPPGKSVLHCTFFTDYAFWKKLRVEDRPRYRSEKKAVTNFVQEFLERHYPGLRGRTEIVSISSPVTTERFTGNHAGSILGWKSFTEAEDLVDELIDKHKMRLPGLAGFYMAGQWAAGGGLIRAAASGRFVTQFICRDLKVPFRVWESQGAGPWQTARLGQLPLLEEELIAQATSGKDEERIQA